MTDKELRKLSRLELLELLLEATEENEKLKEINGKLKEENETAGNIKNLSAATCRVENALKYANELISTLKNTSDELEPTSSKASVEKEKNAPKYISHTDRDIYCRMLCFFAKNEDKLKIFPDDIEYDIKTRIRNILERGRQNNT
ncbi:MAG: hypothetical protein IJB74_00465 [Clostridia bacterium]|nr:hypothetical protein [Clostridia bacterium]